MCFAAPSPLAVDRLHVNKRPPRTNPAAFSFVWKRAEAETALAARPLGAARFARRPVAGKVAHVDIFTALV